MATSAELWAQKRRDALYHNDLWANQAMDVKTGNMEHLFSWDKKNHRNWPQYITATVCWAF